MKVLQLTTLDTQGPECPDEDRLKFDSKVFPGGEPHFRLHDTDWENEDILIVTRINSFNDLGLLAVAVDAIERVGGYDGLILHLPYFPGARQDRVCNPGEALTVDVYGRWTNLKKIFWAKRKVLIRHFLAFECQNKVVDKVNVHRNFKTN